MDTLVPSYSHRQKAPLCLILYGSALACITIAWIVDDTPGIYIAGGVSLLIALLRIDRTSPWSSTVKWWKASVFGPLPLFRRTVRYADIVKVEVGRTLLLDGWGIHLSIRAGWVWNLWGRDWVVVHIRSGSVLRIGTDDPVNLARFLEGKIAQEGK
jgi:hypothetical protein